MNIAMVVYSHYSRDARVRRYVECLARKGHRVDVICLKENYLPKKTNNISLVKYPIARRRSGKLLYIIEYLSFFLYSFFILTVNYFIKKYEVVHIHNMPDFLVFTSFIPKLLGAKIILDMHDPMPELYMSKYQVTRKDPIVRLLIILERFSLGFADQIITANSEFKKIFLLRNNTIENKIDVILNCPDIKIFKPTTNNQQSTINFTLLYMGTVEKRFGLDIAINSIPQLIKKIPNIRFTIIPKLAEEGRYFNSLKKKVHALQITQYVRIEKPLSLEKIAERIKQADVGLVLAKNGVFTNNIFPVKLLEFVQMNIPVIATKTKILNRFFENNAICFLDKNTTSEFTNAVLTLWKSKRLRETITKNAKKYLEKNSWEKEEKKYLKILRILIS